MLAKTQRGMARSIKAHNISLDVFCDWLEGNVLFQDDVELSAVDVVDWLVEEEIYDSQDHAWQLVFDALRELRRRQTWLGQGFPIELTPTHLRRVKPTWRETPSHCFCLALAMRKWYPNWAREFGQDFTEQGELFEELTKTSLQKLFPGWEVYSTGWSRTRTRKLRSVVAAVAACLGEAVGDVERWTKPRANEAGLDLLFYRPFPDKRVGVPVYLLQCASGGDWEGKLHTPNLEIWTKIVQFASKPQKAFATPFALDGGDFVQNCNLVNGMLLDRYRLLSPARDDPDWVPVELRNRIIAWLEPRIERLPKTDG
jgi:hypothetical protein